MIGVSLESRGLWVTLMIGLKNTLITRALAMRTRPLTQLIFSLSSHLFVLLLAQARSYLQPSLMSPGWEAMARHSQAFHRMLLSSPT